MFANGLDCGQPAASKNVISKVISSTRVPQWRYIAKSVTRRIGCFFVASRLMSNLDKTYQNFVMVFEEVTRRKNH